MKRLKHFLAIVFLLSGMAFRAQDGNTEYLDAHFKPTAQESHDYYRQSVLLDSGVVRVETFHADGTRFSMRHYLGDSMEVKHGPAIHWFRNGQVKDSSYYENDKPSGIWRGYYEDGAPYYIVRHQNHETSQKTYYDSNGNIVDESVVHRLPAFPGGEAELFRFLGQTTRYPATALDAGIQGIVYAEFTVDEEGSISDIHILRSVHPELDREVIRVISSFPPWEPALDRGKPVSMYFKLPVRFTLRNEQSERKKRREERRAARRK